MNLILLLSIVYNYQNPVYAFFGFILIAVILILSIREKLRKSKKMKENYSVEQTKSFYVEKDIFGFDKTSINHNESHYKLADKSKFKFIIFISLFLIGLFVVIVYTPKKYRPYQNNHKTTIYELENGSEPLEIKESK